LLVGFLLLRAGLFVFTTAGEYYLYETYANEVRETSLAALYKAKDVEYPPLAVLFGVPATYITDILPAGAARLTAWRPNPTRGPEETRNEVERYEVALGIELFAFDIACLVLVYILARKIYPAEDQVTRIIRLGIYVAATTASGMILYDRQDLVVGLVPLLAIAAFLRNWSGVAYAILMIGTAYKLVPLLLFPLWVFAFAAQRSAPGSTRSFVLAVLRESAIAGLILAMYPIFSYFVWGERSFLFLTFHSARGLQLEAPITWIVFLLDHDTAVGYGYFSHTLRGTLADRTAVALSMAMMLVAVLSVIVCGRGFWRAATTKQPPDRNELATHLVAGSLLMWMGFILFNKVGSPQYLLWPAPLVPLLSLKGSNRWCIAVLILGMVCTTLIFPCLYPQVRGDYTDDPYTWTGPTVLGIILLVAKSIVLTVGFVWLAVIVWRNCPGSVSPVPKSEVP
jgi:hypothetical protein